MRAIAILAATAAMVTLAGCDRLRGGGNANGSANAAANGAAPKAGNDAQGADAGSKLNEGGGAIAASSTGGPIQLDRTYMLGRWTDDGDCDNAVEFTQDGRFVSANGLTGLWRVEGDRLTMSGNGTVVMRIEPVDQNVMTVINEDGSLGRSTRC